MIRDYLIDKRYRSRKWIGFLVLTILTFILVMMDKELAEWIRWATIGYPAFCAANAVLKYNDKEA